MATQTKTIIERISEQGDSVLAAGVLALLAIMLIPLPPFILDMLLASSISLSLLLFVASLYAKKPVEFSVFPTLLLVATVLRLALNVASTRLILLNGAEGEGSAGQIIAAFGDFVVGGNYVVGAIVFTILVIINFVVITKGSGRVAEVAARFTLDAMPGKQMAIDAELNSGLIDEHVARNRRAEVTREADFYGAMDGASKFIRGDAIAGIVITLINIFGGAFIGVFQNDMGLAEATQTYVLLTIGDGLAGQVPALIVSTAAGILVTRVNDTQGRSLHRQISGQLLNNPRVLALVSACMLAMAMIPGLRLPFLTLGSGIGYLAWTWRNVEPQTDAPLPEEIEPAREPTPKDLLPVEPLAIEVAGDLLYLVDERHGGELLQRIKRIRNQFAQDLGLVVPPVHLRDNLALGNGEYRILLRGEEIGTGILFPRQHLALDPGTAFGKLQGIEATDPVFGLPSWWILDGHVLKAQQLGFTVVDVPTVLSTHVVELIQVHGHELLDGRQLDDTLERISQVDKRLVEELVPDRLPRQALLKVFRNLVKEDVSVRDSQTIIEALSDYAGRTSDPDVLTEFVRQRLSRHITRRFMDEDGAIHCIQLGSTAETAILRGLTSNDGNAPNLILDPDVARDVIVQVRDLSEQYSGGGQAVLLCPPLARGAMRRMLERVLPRITVLSSAELMPTAQLRAVGTIELGATT